MIDIEVLVRENINEIVHMSLATCVDGRPWVCEVHYAADNDSNLYFRSKPSRRHSQEIEQNHSVAGNIIKQHSLTDSVVGVYFEGSAVRLENVSANDAAYRSMNARGIADITTLDEQHENDGHAFYKITVHSWYVFGKFGTEPARKYELKWSEK